MFEVILINCFIKLDIAGISLSTETNSVAWLPLKCSAKLQIAVGSVEHQQVDLDLYS